MAVTDLVLVLIGLAGLYFGGEALVRGASRLAASLGVPSLIIGLTIVAMGTSMPEMLVSVDAALTGLPDIALGNVVGSNIANIGLILGLTALVRPITIESTLVRREIPIMIICSIAMFIMAADGSISALDGILLLVGFIGFNLLMFRLTQQEAAAGHIEPQPESVVKEESKPTNRVNDLLLIAFGILLLLIGARALVTGAVSIARGFGISELVIGLTLVAVGTSLPEMATSIVAALRGESNIAVGNVVGSNIANILAIMGVTGTLHNVPVAAGIIQIQLPVMLAFALLILPLSWRDLVLRRLEGVLLLGLYFGFVVLTFQPTGV